jgi:glycosyltransferase involved in cell wall biosynthesis
MSVLEQTHPFVHLVVVDDASTDGTAELIRGYELCCPRVTAICKEANRGVADTIITGLSQGPEADYVAILNDDDFWYPTKLERQLERFAADPAVGLVFCEAVIVDDNDQLTGQLFSDLYAKLDLGDALGSLLRANHACASTLLMTREIADIAAHTLPEPSFVWDYYIMLLAAGYSSIDYVDEPLAAYRIGATGEHNTRLDEMWRDTTRARQALFQRHPDLVRRVGGPAAARRITALRTLDVAVRQLRAGAWREYVWHAREVLRQRRARVSAWLLIHTIHELWLLFRTRPPVSSRPRRPSLGTPDHPQ